MDRDTAALYCTSFITWMKGAINNAPRSSSKKLTLQLLEFEKAYESLVKSYEEEIADLKNQLELGNEATL